MDAQKLYNELNAFADWAEKNLDDKEKAAYHKYSKKQVVEQLRAFCNGIDDIFPMNQWPKGAPADKPRSPKPEKSSL